MDTWVKKYNTFQEAKDSGNEITRYNWEYYYFGEENDGITDEIIQVNGSADNAHMISFSQSDDEDRKFGTDLVDEFLAGTAGLDHTQSNSMLGAFSTVIMYLQLGSINRANEELATIDFVSLGLPNETKTYFTTQMSLHLQERA